MRDFRKLQIWKDAVQLVISTYKIMQLFPSAEKFELSSQMRRAAVSVPSNIAEGCSRNSAVEFKRFLEIAIGSTFELETQLIIAGKLGYISELKLDQEIKSIHELQKRINRLISKIKSDL
ncbi:MAG: four helix bundle protein [Bacteroidota bacterium]|jgi:four helix bundle protein|nr:four helix bundle protein [Sphingobacteriales bacterium]